MSMIRVRTLQYSLESCVLLCFFFFCKYQQLFLRMIRVIRIIYECDKHFYEFMSLNEYVWIKHISNVMSLMSVLYSYSLQPVSINQHCSEYEWIRVVEFQYCWLEISWVLVSSEKTIHYSSLMHMTCNCVYGTQFFNGQNRPVGHLFFVDGMTVD